MLLGLSKLASQFGLCCYVFILLIISRIMLVLFAIALLLRLCELTSQLILLHSIDFVIAILLIAFVLSTLCFASFFFGSSL